MEWVGELVGVHADERGCHAVDGAIELVWRDPTELAGEAVLYEREQHGNEGTVTAHVVLKEARLRLVHAHGGAASERGAVEVGIHALLIEIVAHFVHHARDAAHEVVRIDVVCRDHIVAGHGLREGVLGRGEVVGAFVDALQACDVLCELPLARLVEVALYAGTAEGAAAHGDG